VLKKPKTTGFELKKKNSTVGKHKPFLAIKEVPHANFRILFLHSRRYLFGSGPPEVFFWLVWCCQTALCTLWMDKRKSAALPGEAAQHNKGDFFVP